MPSKEYYLIKTPENTYYAKIYHQYPTVDKIYIGGDQWCVDISIYLDGDENPNIDGIGYDKKCNVTLDGTKHMIFCAFAFIKVIYKNVYSIYMFKDTSTIDCNGFNMLLSHFYILHHGKTWYQAHFKATPGLKEDLNKFKEYIKTKVDAKELFESVRGEKRKSYLIELYEPCENIKEFLTKVKTLDCSIYKYWGEQLVNKQIPFIKNIEWQINTNKLDLPVINIERQETKPKKMKIHKGGRKMFFSSPPS